MRNADVAIIEGVMGLFDGRKQTLGTASTAEVAKLLNAPVLLVLDVSHMGQSAAAIVHGFQHIDPQINIAGVIVNRVASVDHEATVRLAIAEWTGVPVLGVLRRDASLALPARHLGLIPIAETAVEIERLGAVITRAVDLASILCIARGAGSLPAGPPDPTGADSRVSRASGIGEPNGQYHTINEIIPPGCLIHPQQPSAWDIDTPLCRRGACPLRDPCGRRSPRHISCPSVPSSRAAPGRRREGRHKPLPLHFSYRADRRCLRQCILFLLSRNA